MSLFKQFLESKGNNKIVVVMDSYEQGLRETIKNAIWQEEYIHSAESEKLAIEEMLLAQRYPKVNNFMIALESRNPHKIHAAYDAYHCWHGGNLPAILIDFKSKALCVLSRDC